MCLHWELSTCLPSPTHVLDERRGRPCAGVWVSQWGVTHGACSSPIPGGSPPSRGSIAVAVRGCRQHSWPSSPGFLDQDRQTPACGPLEGTGALPVGDTGPGRIRWRSTGGHEQSHPSCCWLPSPCLCLCLAQRGAQSRAVLRSWSQRSTAAQGLRSHFFINYF